MEEGGPYLDRARDEAFIGWLTEYQKEVLSPPTLRHAINRLSSTAEWSRAEVLAVIERAVGAGRVSLVPQPGAVSIVPTEEIQQLQNAA